MSDYKALTAYEKLQQMQQLRFARCERSNAAIYLKALWLNNVKVIEEYERFGNSVSKILDNKRVYDRQALFGYSDIKFDKHGRLVRAELLDYERIELQPHGKHTWISYIDFGRTPKHTWVCGYGASDGTGGVGFGASIWGQILASKEDALKTAINDFINWHKSRNSTANNRFITIATEYLETQIPKPVKQLSLF
jgi:hypothetical protein